MANPIMRFFEYAHLPESLQQISQPICELAHQMNARHPESAEKTAGLRKLLEAKDCFVRCTLQELAPGGQVTVTSYQPGEGQLEAGEETRNG